MKRLPIDPELLRDRLAEAQGKRYWRSLEELAGEPSVQEMLQREFPDGAAEWADPVSRRRFLTLMGASLALAGLAGCSRPTGTIVPYVKQPENLVPGKPLYYATAMTQGAFATGLLVESHEGRPTKIEGNPQHPASLGATTTQQQAAILGLYDPDRSQVVAYREQPRAWGAFLEEIRARLERDGRSGKSIAVLSETVASPTLLAQRDAFLTAYPQARWFVWEPIGRENVHAGARLALGQEYHSYHKLDDADVIVALDADFLCEGPGCLAYSRQFAARRREGGGKNMNRLYSVETDLTTTGARADHRLAVRPSQVEAFAQALAGRLGLFNDPPKLDDEMSRWVAAVAEDLRSRGPGRTVVIVGDRQPPAVHAIGHAINFALKNFGKTVLFTEPLPSSRVGAGSSLPALVEAVKFGDVDTLLILGGDPAFTAPADLRFAGLLQGKLKDPKSKWLAVRLGEYFDETSRLCHWHVPQAHFLEQWSDGVAYDGTACVVQPLIAPLYGGKSPHELLAALTMTDPGANSYDSRSADEVVKAHWKTNQPTPVAEPFPRYWQRALHEGILAGTKPSTVTPTVADDLSARPELRPVAPKDSAGLELVFAADPAVYDGRFANNGWLQEWPRPITRLSWGNAVVMGPETAKTLKVSTRVNTHKGGEHGNTVADLVLVEAPRGGWKLSGVPVWIVPGHAEGAITVHLGNGRERAGRVGTRVGFNAYQLRLTGSPWLMPEVKVTVARGTQQMACQQAHHSMEGRDIVRSGTWEEFRKDPHFATKHGHGPAAEPGKKVSLPTLYDGKDHPYDGYKWGMAIDLSACTGCGACVVACQSENNIPVVGKEQVLRAREMHWLRIDRYFETPKDEPDAAAHVHFQPLPCMHCENAPCELVCPVEATVHGDEGTNDMVYNRCVGTRYCANNCPYKVRRFNFYQYGDYDTPSRKLGYNPDVTVRTRGVMEKCTFCIQRISHARIESSKEALDGDSRRIDRHDRKVQGKAIPYILDGEVLTACQAACPAQAIVFGDLNDSTSRVAKLAESPLRYDLLGELGTRPRVFYLASIRNPNLALEGK